ncbi:hypothetical protein ACFL3R_01340 [Thermodesulfobacteriota bacterium]
MQKRNYYIVPICGFLLVMFLFTHRSYAGNVEAENVRIVKEHSNAWAVKGMVRNLENHSIKGYVKIKFLNSQGDVLKTAKTYVNDRDPLSPGQAGSFEYWASPSDFQGVVNFQIIFKDM